MAVRLPSLQALRAFEAAARLGSFKQAGEELFVTPTAISHHIRSLEEELGAPLFVRKTRKVEVTDAGRALAQSMGHAFEEMGRAVSKFKKERERPTVTIAMGPLLASRWLTPRLSPFWHDFPDVDLRILHTGTKIEPGVLDADIYLAWGDGFWSEMAVQPILKVTGTPVASPSLLNEIGKPEHPHDLLRFPLLHQRDHEDWEKWFFHAGHMDGVPMRGIVFEDSSLIVRNAVLGQGVAIGWFPLIQEELDQGQLVRLFDDTLTNERAYHLITPKVGNKIVRQVADWLLAQA